MSRHPKVPFPHAFADALFWVLVVFFGGFCLAAAILSLPGCSSPPRPSEPEARGSLATFERGLSAAEQECSRANARSHTTAACERPVVAARDGVYQARLDPTFENIACAAAAVRFGLGALNAAMTSDGLVPPLASRAAVAGAWPLAEHATCYPESPTSRRSHSEDPSIPRIDPKPPNW